MLVGPFNQEKGEGPRRGLLMAFSVIVKTDRSFAALIKSAHKIPDQIPCRFEAIKLFRIQQAIRDVKPTKVWIYIKGFDAPAVHCSMLWLWIYGYNYFPHLLKYNSDTYSHFMTVVSFK